MWPFRSLEDNMRVLLKKKYPELYNITDKEKQDILYNLENIKWGDIEESLYSISCSYDFKYGKSYLLFSDMNRYDHDVITIVKYKYYPDGITIDGIKKPTVDYKFSLRVKSGMSYEYMIFDTVRDVYDFIWSEE
ncbi:MAG: hypothetical protein WC175_05365 [Candidatus Dojkabacteria bacterium]